MRGICDIRGCKNNEAGKKIHEEFEDLEEINICWECGNKILDAIARGVKE